MKKRDIILFIGIIVASIIGTRSFANTEENSSQDKKYPRKENSIIESIKGNPELSVLDGKQMVKVNK
ncbi:hypothetical protein [Marivirga harenae]|uniref:hypothetical protein n=1 Tax=Marivirga harenae TaxID=2010992 RepID=UPI0026E0F718|nr:hypothetical protein [Marivirga harenae]WKV12609.1 hypothetical protein Q3Y49_02015 [Marivirga harenae]|tara:strand:+ start:22045 stop:22245 length:201 start_codon:yes stop_codon:yes gene_type:complete